MTHGAGCNRVELDTEAEAAADAEEPGYDRILKAGELDADAVAEIEAAQYGVEPG